MQWTKLQWFLSPFDCCRLEELYLIFAQNIFEMVFISISATSFVPYCYVQFNMVGGKKVYWGGTHLAWFFNIDFFLLGHLLYIVLVMEPQQYTRKKHSGKIRKWDKTDHFGLDRPDLQPFGRSCIKKDMRPTLKLFLLFFSIWANIICDCPV